jgi:hypothetical protein
MVQRSLLGWRVDLWRLEMPVYGIDVFCTACSTVHPVGVGIRSAQEVPPNRSIAAVYEGRDLPTEFVTILVHTARCPVSGNVISARNYSEVFLARLGDSSDQSGAEVA